MTGIDLFPRTSSIFTDYCTAEGQVIYRVEARSQWNSKTITIRKVIPGNFDNQEEPALRDELVELGRIDLWRFSTHTISFPEEKDLALSEGPTSGQRDKTSVRTTTADPALRGSGGLGTAMKVTDVFKRRGWPKIETLSFNGPDGRSYDWIIGVFMVKVCLSLVPPRERGLHRAFIAQ